ncbi:MAG: hypothetical protein J5U19_11905 [Candidatus Methanoperedens sp.]|nr:hypothetical protein [Candidatus Methanoperedens sp.]
MPDIFLIPIINMFEVHDAAMREWLNGLDQSSLRSHLDYPFRLERFFPETVRRALKRADEVHKEILELLDIIDPDAIFLDISIDLIELENKYNKRSISTLEFWSLCYHIPARIETPFNALYNIYIKEIFKRSTRFLENKENLPLSVVFYGEKLEKHENFINLYRNVLLKDDQFLLQMARTVNEITSFRERPKHLWHSWAQDKLMAISYEETEQFYDELLSRMKGLLEFKIRDFIVKNLRNDAAEFVNAYENFLDNNKTYDGSVISNIFEGLKVITRQSEFSSIVIFCAPWHYSAILYSLKKDTRLPGMNIAPARINIDSLIDKMKPFLQKDRIIENDYNIALNILGRKKPDRSELTHNMIS